MMNRELLQLREEIKELRRRITQRPVAPTYPRNAVEFLIVDQGNTLDSGQPGIKHLTTLLTSMPVYDPNTATSFIDGVGRARLVKGGVLQSGYVLVCNDVRSLWSASLLRDDTIAVAALVVISDQTLYLPI